MRLSDEQVRETVGRMRMRPAVKAMLLAQALGGDASARFVVYGYARTLGVIGRERASYFCESCDVGVGPLTDAEAEEQRKAGHILHRLDS